MFRIELPTQKQKAAAAVKVLPESKCPELLANYCDLLLRKTPLSKRLTSDEIDSKLHDVVSGSFSFPPLPCSGQMMLCLVIGAEVRPEQGRFHAIP